MKKESDRLKLKFLQLNKTVLLTFFFDLLFYGSIALGVLAFSVILKNVLQGLTQLDYANIITSDINAANANLLILKAVFGKMISTILGFILFSVVSFTLFKGMIWARLTKSRFTLRYFLKTLAMNSLFAIIFLILSLYFLLSVKSKVLALVTLVIFLHFSAFSYCFISKDTKNRVFSSIWKTLKLTIRVDKYFIPYLVLIIVFLGLTLPTQFILARILPFQYFEILVIFLIIFYISVVRNYFAASAEEITR